MANTTILPTNTATHANHTIYLPWTWTIVSTDATAHPCPSVSSVLTTFAIVNLVASLLTLLFGNRRFVHDLTRGKLGSASGKLHWKWNWIFNVGLNLLANAIIAGIIKHSVGYKADFKLWELTLFLLARPRLTWIVMAFMADKWGKTISVDMKIEDQAAILLQQGAGMGFVAQDTAYKPVLTAEVIPLHSQPSSSTLNTLWTSEIHDDPVTGPTEKPVERRWDLPYYHTFLSAFIAEVLMQLAALYVMGITVKFAWQKGYYNVGFNHTLYKSVPHGAHLMYAGALYYLIGGSISLGITMLALLMQFRIADPNHKNTSMLKFLKFIAVVFLLATTFLGSWLFWAGFVKLAGHYYCPPKLASHAAVWTLASMFGAFFGAGA